VAESNNQANKEEGHNMENQQVSKFGGNGKVWHTTVDSSGRVLVPSELRHEIGVEAGTQMVWARDGSGLKLRSFDETLHEIQNYYTSLAPASDVWSEALIRERRQEASHE
jgi:bifunctional DNA-binding transcriptional regulator/antitoxin component of YhaV-PrlF toxin-antitoxin module